MLDTVISEDPNETGRTSPTLDEKCRRVVDRRRRLDRLSKMHAPDIIVRNERRMLEAALNDLFGDSEVGDVIARIGTAAFTTYFNILAGIELQAPIASSAAVTQGEQCKVGGRSYGRVH